MLLSEFLRREIVGFNQLRTYLVHVVKYLQVVAKIGMNLFIYFIITNTFKIKSYSMQGSTIDVKICLTTCT